MVKPRKLFGGCLSHLQKFLGHPTSRARKSKRLNLSRARETGKLRLLQLGHGSGRKVPSDERTPSEGGLLEQRYSPQKKKKTRPAEASALCSPLRFLAVGLLVAVLAVVLARPWQRVFCDRPEVIFYFRPF